MYLILINNNSNNIKSSMKTIVDVKSESWMVPQNPSWNIRNKRPSVVLNLLACFVFTTAGGFSSELLRSPIATIPRLGRRGWTSFASRSWDRPSFSTASTGRR